jgi:hypothetical protein
LQIPPGEGEVEETNETSTCETPSFNESSTGLKRIVITPTVFRNTFDGLRQLVMRGSPARGGGTATSARD